jgi:hypothetical protein
VPDAIVEGREKSFGRRNFASPSGYSPPSDGAARPVQTSSTESTKQEKNMVRVKIIGLSVALWFAALVTGMACSEDGENGSCDAEEKGFTTCGLGSVKCQPGQYCDDFQQCQNGCLSDVNCACNQVCSKPAGVNEGTCVAEPVDDDTGAPMTGGATDPTADPTEAGDPKELCKEYCSLTDFFSCYMPGDLQACFDACDAASDAQIEQYSNCFIMAVGLPGADRLRGEPPLIRGTASPLRIRFSKTNGRARRHRLARPLR